MLYARAAYRERALYSRITQLIRGDATNERSGSNGSIYIGQHTQTRYAAGVEPVPASSVTVEALAITSSPIREKQAYYSAESSPGGDMMTKR